MIRNIKAVTGSCYLSMLFLGIGGAVVGAAARNIGLTPSQIGLIIAIQNVGFGMAVWLSGALSDTTSKPRLLLIGSLILVLAALGIGWRYWALGQQAASIERRTRPKRSSSQNASKPAL